MLISQDLILGVLLARLMALTGQQATALRGPAAFRLTKEQWHCFVSSIKHSTMRHLPRGNKRVDT